MGDNNTKYQTAMKIYSDIGADKFSITELVSLISRYNGHRRFVSLLSLGRQVRKLKGVGDAELSDVRSVLFTLTMSTDESALHVPSFSYFNARELALACLVQLAEFVEVDFSFLGPKGLNPESEMVQIAKELVSKGLFATQDERDGLS
jgi:hypothetical protein